MSLKQIFSSFQKTRTDFEIETSNNLDEKANFLKIDGKGKLSLFCGLITVEGSASFLKDDKKTNQVASVTMHYKFEDRFEELPPELIQVINFQRVPFFYHTILKNLNKKILHKSTAVNFFDKMVNTMGLLKIINLYRNRI